MKPTLRQREQVSLNKKIFMLIFLYGEDSYRSRQKLDEIKEKAKKADPSEMNIITIEGGEAEFNQIKKAVLIAPFLSRTKLVILKNILFEGKKDLKENLISFLKEEKIPQSSHLVFWEGGLPDQKERLFKTLQKLSRFENFELLEGVKLNNWIEKEVERRKGKIERQAVFKLASFVGPNLHLLTREIEKLILYTKEAGRPISALDIDRLVVAQLDTNIFDFIDALAAKNKKSALAILHDQMRMGTPDVYLLSMITYQFRNMILISDLLSRRESQYQISKETKIHPYVVKKTISNVYRFNQKSLRRIYQKLHETDINLKRTTLDPKLSLNMLVYDLCK